MIDVIGQPLTAVEKAELLEACKQGLTANGLLLLRRLMFELDWIKEKHAAIRELEVEKTNES